MTAPRASAQKRTTSSAGYRFPGQPASDRERAALTGSEITPEMRPREWSAEVVKVQRCKSTEYDGGHGYKTEFEYSTTDRSKNAILFGQGDIRKLSLRLIISSAYKDPSSITHSFNIIDDENLYIVRLFDYKVSMNLQIESKRVRGRGRPKREQESDYWVIYFKGDNQRSMNSARAMLRRVQNITVEMSDKWFKYRNYFTKGFTFAVPNTAEEQSSQGSVRQGEYYKGLPGDYSVRWTGFLAMPEFLRALGHEDIRPQRPQSPDTVTGDEGVTQSSATAAGSKITTRSAAKKQGAFKHSSLPLRTKTVAEPGTKKQVVAAKKAKKEEGRRSRRAALLDPESGSNDEDNDDQGFSGPSSPQAEAKDAGEVESFESSDDSNTCYAVKGILEDRIEEGVQEYLVDWIGDYNPSWESSENIDPGVIKTYEQEKSAKHTASNRGRGSRGRGNRGRGTRGRGHRGRGGKSKMLPMH